MISPSDFLPPRKSSGEVIIVAPISEHHHQHREIDQEAPPRPNRRLIPDETAAEAERRRAEKRKVASELPTNLLVRPKNRLKQAINALVWTFGIGLVGWQAWLLFNGDPSKTPEKPGEAELLLQEKSGKNPLDFLKTAETQIAADQKHPSQLVGSWELRNDDGRQSVLELAADGTMSWHSWNEGQEGPVFQKRWIVVDQKLRDFTVEFSSPLGNSEVDVVQVQLTSGDSLTISQPIFQPGASKDPQRFVKRTNVRK